MWHHIYRRKPQKGFFTIGIAIALLAAALVVVGTAKTAIHQMSVSSGTLIGNQLQTVDNALIGYINANNSNLIKSTPSVTGVANPLSPTVTELKSLNFLNSNVSNTPTVGGSYNISITVSPTGCTSSCSVTGAVWLSNPIYANNNKNSDIFLLGSALSSSTTGQIGYSTNANPGTIQGPGWSFNNPAGNVAGILYATTNLSSNSSITQYWLQSVGTQIGLPSSGNNLGDGRLTQDTNKPYTWNGTNWQELFSYYQCNPYNFDCNISIGQYSGDVKLGNGNLFIGNGAGKGVTGSSNTIEGNGAGINGGSGWRNTIYGYNAGQNSGASLENSIFGAYAGLTNSGGSNAIFGSRAGQNTSVSGASLFGAGAGSNAGAISTASYAGWGAGPIYIGNNAGMNASGGGVIVGSNSGPNINGWYNTILGNNSGLNTITPTGSFNAWAGASNVFIGYYTGNTNTMGAYNTVIGQGADVASNNLNNASAFGYSAIAPASNSVRIGNTAVTLIGGQVPWSNLSDRRLKKSITSSKRGLDFIRKLNPVDYVLKDNQKHETGFIAQDVEKIDPSFPGVNKPTNNKDYYSLTYTDFIPSIVKSIQELDKRSDAASHYDKIEYSANKLEIIHMVLLTVIALMFSFCLWMLYKLRLIEQKLNLLKT